MSDKNLKPISLSAMKEKLERAWRFKFAFQKLTVPKVGDIVIQTVEERQATLEEYKNFKAEIASNMTDAVTKLRTIEQMDAEEASIYVTERKLLGDAITEMLAFPEPAWTISVMAYADAMLRTCPDNRRAVERTADLLARTGFLREEDKHGSGVRVYGRYFRLTPKFHQNQEAVELLRRFPRLVERATVAGRELFQQDLRQLKKAVGPEPLTREELLSGREGRILVEVREEKSATGEILRSGFLLLESSRGLVSILDAAGGLRKSARLLADAKAEIPVNQLTNNRPRFPRRLDQQEYSVALSAFFLLKRALRLTEPPNSSALTPPSDPSAA